MTTNNNRHGATPMKPSIIEHRGMGIKFLIVNRPSPTLLPQFIKDLKTHAVKVVVRCCDPSYSIDPLTEEGIRVVDLPFEDGAAPPNDIIRQWIELVKEVVEEEQQEGCIAVHCVAGLGRAPVLVAVALIEHGVKYHIAVAKIREKRRGAINQKQLQFLESYKPMYTGKTCSIM